MPKQETPLIPSAKMIDSLVNRLHEAHPSIARTEHCAIICAATSYLTPKQVFDWYLANGTSLQSEFARIRGNEDVYFFERAKSLNPTDCLD
jgi:hypothetical protein